MQYQCNNPVLYVGECYSKYYELILLLLSNIMESITVTGSPGEVASFVVLIRHPV
ncbi:hypothetical protein PHMEG_0002172 [Phytophthora megakarya]|uniref:Uncharacterized protein n=1 Tax=Phytophthora megakarya TaxID=4795 RepID=A0A225WYV6_9STRA|nr:hypothetical protein PHMEG_0002172 [Phytophthora megakarya]